MSISAGRLRPLGVSAKNLEDRLMEPLNLMVSLSHFANDNRDTKHGLSERAGRRRRTNKSARRHSWWVIRSRVRVLS